MAWGGWGEDGWLIGAVEDTQRGYGCRAMTSVSIIIDNW